MPEKQPSAIQQVLKWIQNNHAKRPSFGAQMKTLARDAVNDVRGKVHEFFFGKPESIGAMGTAINPTPQQIQDGLKRDDRSR
jgi:hypothetical protein